MWCYGDLEGVRYGLKLGFYLCEMAIVDVGKRKEG